MKILIVTHYFLPHAGGIEIVAYNQAKELVKQGHEVTIVSSKIGDEPEEEVMDEIKIRRIPAWNWFEDHWGVPYPVYSFKLLKIMKEEVNKTDIVHVHDLSYLSSFIGALAARLNKRPLILMQHVKKIETKNKIVNIIQSIIFSTSGRYIVKASNKIVVCNEETSKWMNKKDKTVFLPNGVDTNLFYPTNNKKRVELRKKYGLLKDKKIVLFVGRLVEKKGFDKLFESRSRDYLILFVGDGVIPNNMKNDKNVKFFRAMSQKKLNEIYQLSDIFCLPSKNEGFPLTILEAMSAGLPIITSDHPGYDKYLDKKYVKMIEPTPFYIKKSIEELLKSKKLMQKMTKYSRNSAVSKFSWKHNASKLLKTYNEVIK